MRDNTHCFERKIKLKELFHRDWTSKRHQNPHCLFHLRLVIKFTEWYQLKNAHLSSRNYLPYANTGSIWGKYCEPPFWVGWMLAFPVLLLVGQWCASWVYSAKSQNLPEQTPLQSISLCQKTHVSSNVSQSSVKSLWILGVVTWWWYTCIDRLTVAQGERNPSYFDLCPCSLEGGQHGRRCVWDSLLFPFCFPPADSMCRDQAWIKCHGCPQMYNCFLNATPLANAPVCHDCVQCFPLLSMLQHWVGFAICCLQSELLQLADAKAWNSFTLVFIHPEVWGNLRRTCDVSALCTGETTASKKCTNKCSVIWSKPVSSVEKRQENPKDYNGNMSINDLYSRQVACWLEWS